MTELQHAAKATRPRIQPAEEGDRRPLSVSARLGRLQFHQSGKFRVLQFADIQDGPKVSKDTISLIEASLDATRPDLVIFNGNQIAGYDSAYALTSRKRRWDARPASASSEASGERYAAALEHTRELVRATIEQLVHPLADRGVPWAVTFGNHDFQCGLDNDEIESICREFPGCINPERAADGTTGIAVKHGVKHDVGDMEQDFGLPEQPVIACAPGTFALSVTDVDRTYDVMAAQSQQLQQDRQDEQDSPREPRKTPSTLPCMVFQHFPIEQYYRLLKPVAATAARAIEGYRNFAGRHFVLNEDKTQPGSYLGEGVSCPDADSGEFAILDKAGYFAISAGHDHRNAFVGSVPVGTDGDRQMMMVASPTSGFGSYGPVPAKRAARLFEFDIRHPYEPRTQLLEYDELVGKPSAGKAYAYGMTSESKPDSEGMDLLHRPTWWSKTWNKLVSLFRR